MWTNQFLLFLLFLLINIIVVVIVVVVVGVVVGGGGGCGGGGGRCLDSGYFLQCHRDVHILSLFFADCVGHLDRAFHLRPSGRLQFWQS